MSAAALSEYTAVSKYARYLKSEKRRETWEEAVGRTEGMMLGRFPDLRPLITESYDFVRRKEVLPSMRSLQFGGAPVLKHAARSYNCTASYCDRLRFFQECFYLLLCGCGTGFSVQEHHVASLPRFSAARRAGRRLPRKVFRVPDCIEGWADAEGVLLSSYHEEPVPGLEEWQDCEVEFDASGVRRKGSDLSCGIGKAPGPGPLVEALRLGRGLLDRTLAAGRDKLGSLEAYDLTMYFADASVAGGVRRSASICIFSPWDLRMATAKTGRWQAENPQRARSNNSAALLRGKTTWEEFWKFFEFVRQWGEPGFFWTDDFDLIPNPCCEIVFFPRLAVEGTARSTAELLKSYSGPVARDTRTNNTLYLSGWQCCNLSTINGKTVRGEDDFLCRCEAASNIGTLQASFTEFPYLGPVTERIVRKEALLGVAICGMMHHPGLLLDPAVQRRGARVVLDANERLAREIGINPCARGTCVKPDGKSSAVLMSDPGVHPGHSRRHFRLSQVNRQEVPYRHFRAHNPLACERSVWNKAGTDDVIRFCIEEPDGTVLKEHLSAVEFLRNVRLTYANWVQAGRRPERCTHPAVSNNVSNTCTVRDGEWDEAAREIFTHQESYGGVSLAPASCDRDYEQAPYTAVYTPAEQEALYGRDAVGTAPSLLDMLRGAGFVSLWDACDCALGFWPPDRTPSAAQADWLAAFGAFAADLFAGDARRASYCLKDAWNWDLWCRLRESYREVDYTTMVEEDDGTTLQQEAACSGGQCLVNI